MVGGIGTVGIVVYGSIGSQVVDKKFFREDQFAAGDKFGFASRKVGWHPLNSQ